MKEVTRLITGWQTSSTNSNQDPAFVAFKRIFKSAMTAELKKVNAEDIVFSYGHYYVSGFFTKGNQPYYFSISDVRFFKDCKVLYRTAKDYGDFTGGHNMYAPMEKDMFLKTGISCNEYFN